MGKRKKARIIRAAAVGLIAILAIIGFAVWRGASDNQAAEGISGTGDSLVLDVKEHSYFTERNMSNEHGGGVLFAFDEEIMGWLFSH